MQQPSSRLIQHLTNRDQGLDWKAPFKIGPLPQWHSRCKKKSAQEGKGKIRQVLLALTVTLNYDLLFQHLKPPLRKISSASYT